MYFAEELTEFAQQLDVEHEGMSKAKDELKYLVRSRKKSVAAID